jgi:hypothetical protein
VLTQVGKEKLDALFGSLRKAAKRLLSGYSAGELDQKNAVRLCRYEL